MLTCLRTRYRLAGGRPGALGIAMSERRGGPTDLFAVEGQRAYQRSMMVEAGFLGVR